MPLKPEMLKKLETLDAKYREIEESLAGNGASADVELLKKLGFRIKAASSFKKYHMNTEFKSYIFEYPITKTH